MAQNNDSKETLQNRLNELNQSNVSDFTLEEVQQWTRDATALNMVLYEPNNDFFILDYDAVCVKSSFTYSFDNIKIGEELFLGEIKRTGIRKTWENFDANILESGTKIYQYPNWNTKVIAIHNGKYFVYDKPINGQIKKELYDGEIGQLVNIDIRNFTPEQNGRHIRNVEAKTSLHNNPDDDFFILETYLCKRYDKINIADETISDKELLGTIKRTGIQNNWEEWDATKLKIGTRIYQQPNQYNTLMAINNGNKTAYIKYLDIIKN
jgi:hypothetical protein